ncbi:MAG: DNA-binding protein [Acholeplasmatales bacterium]|nr:DNA-binding protein [Acholeplasmatales bacterium]
MEKDRELICGLYDLYSNLLTEKQKNYFEDYYFMDLSLAEIAENNNVSRNAVFDQIKRTVNTLLEIEEAVKLNEKIEKIQSMNLDSEIKENIISILKE